MYGKLTAVWDIMVEEVEEAEEDHLAHACIITKHSNQVQAVRSQSKNGSKSVRTIAAEKLLKVILA